MEMVPRWKGCRGKSVQCWFRELWQHKSWVGEAFGEHGRGATGPRRWCCLSGSSGLLQGWPPSHFNDLIAVDDIYENGYLSVFVWVLIYLGILLEKIGLFCVLEAFKGMNGLSRCEWRKAYQEETGRGEFMLFLVHWKTKWKSIL